MATGGTSPDKVFTLPNSKIIVTVSSGDIFTTTASAIIVGEDPTFSGQGIVSDTLLKRGSEQFRKNRDKLRPHPIPPLKMLGKVYKCDFPPKVDAQTHDTMHFNVVFFAIVPSFRKADSVQDWQNTMKKLYWNVIKAANKEGKKSIAIPVLGSGGAGAPVEKAIDILSEALETFQYKKDDSQNLKEIIVYCHQDKAYECLVHKLQTRSSPLESPESSSLSSTRRRTTKKSTGRQETERSISRESGEDPSVSNLACILRDSSTRDKDVGGKNHAEDKNTGKNVDSRKKEEEMSTEEKDESNKEKLKHMEKTKQQDADDDTEETKQRDADQKYEDIESWQNHKEETKQSEDEDTCAICLDKIDKPKKLDKCGHVFCTKCIEDSFRHHKPACPACNTMYGLVTGNQPKGRMEAHRDPHTHLPGYQNCGTIIIDYDFPSGTQGKEHPNPGQAYLGTQRRAFLPDTKEGKKVYRLLRVAFTNRLTFTIGKSRTTGADNVVTWNDIHHKTNIHGGTTYFGYPDPLYLSRVEEELAAKGVTEECLQGKTFDI